MESLEILLSDEFVAFSTKIKEIFANKKAKQEELRKVYDSYKAEFKALDDEAKELQVEFEAWKEQWIKNHTKVANSADA
jgi:predicted  nucleic acid-binding Zn-ribbon protein